MMDGLCLVVIVYSSTGDDKVGAKGPMMGIVQPLLYKYNVLAYIGGHQHYLNVSMDYYHSIPYLPCTYFSTCSTSNSTAPITLSVVTVAVCRTRCHPVVPRASPAPIPPPRSSPTTTAVSQCSLRRGRA